MFRVGHPRGQGVGAIEYIIIANSAYPADSSGSPEGAQIGTIGSSAEYLGGRGLSMLRIIFLIVSRVFRGCPGRQNWQNWPNQVYEASRGLALADWQDLFQPPPSLIDRWVLEPSAHHLSAG